MYNSQTTKTWKRKGRDRVSKEKEEFIPRSARRR